MPRTPDYFPGEREEEAILLLSGSDYPAKNGESTYVSGSGFRFFEEGIVKQLGIDEPTHEALNTLAHDIAFTSYDEVSYNNYGMTHLDVWTNSGKTNLLQDFVITYGVSRLITVLTSSAYDVTGSLKSQIIEVPIYDDKRRIINIVRTKVL